MTAISKSNQQWLVQSLDRNQNQKLEELTVSPELKAQLDRNQNGELQTHEVQQALQADRIEIRQGQILEHRPQSYAVQGRETLEHVHSNVSETLHAPHVVAPRAADVIDAVVSLLVEDKRSPEQRRRDRMHQLELSNLSYMSAVGSMRSSLRTVIDMTAEASDSRSKAIHASAQSALNSSASWGTGVAVTGFLLGVSGLESINNGLQVAYSSLKSNLQSIEAQTRNLPEPVSKIQATDHQIASAFAQVQNLEKLQGQNDQSLRSLSEQSQAMTAKVTGRTGPYALVGAGAGAVAGAAAGYFLGGRNLKSALVGAGVGTAASAGLGALVGSGIDHSYHNKAQALQKQIETLKSFQPEQDRQKLQDLNHKLYDLSVQTQGLLDLDSAGALEHQANEVSNQVGQVQQKLDQVAAAHQKAKP